ncbi:MULTISPECIES: hypothetical protein [Pasteurellaceae]|uniref:Uncharacterized protein n=1 Tax=Actinobacillus equuli TaxID=718 RepID=A0AAX3FHZ7_ACTEU|nr:MULTISPECIES: hypothetical protein [Pasteurellaceae]AIJ31188.1 hypothetical protein ASU1_04600 [Actinobacillus suis ATCC 33415]AIZ79106.1 hypothetical protein ACEE_04835 [Actinobacillus equuli subsp. equuli]EFL80072.1 hypothetical protein APP6_0553 [Actinobacillus pleuropneumoniae serovar 6 str. Femo]NNI17116.1 hypothetical protein [Pasteurella multocida]NNI27775.1 hypothetical protein [Pasteurella multocida]
MKKYGYLWLGFFIFPSVSYAQREGQICHAQDAPYNYAGIWEMNTFGQPICNYWQFLGEKERSIIEAHLNEYGEVIFDEYEQGSDLGQEHDLNEYQRNETKTDESIFIIIEE